VPVKPLFEDRIEAWPQGPVILSIYKKQSQKVQGVRMADGSRCGDCARPSRTPLDWVLAKYSHFSAESLSRITHLELPWKNARQLLAASEKSSEEIPVRHMQHYYARQLADVESAVSHAAASSSLEGIDLDEEWQDVLRSGRRRQRVGRGCGPAGDQTGPNICDRRRSLYGPRWHVSEDLLGLTDSNELRMVRGSNHQYSRRGTRSNRAAG